MDEKKYTTSFQVISADSLQELAQGLNVVSRKCWSVAVLKTMKEENVYRCLVKVTEEIK